MESQVEDIWSDGYRSIIVARVVDSLPGFHTEFE